MIKISFEASNGDINNLIERFKDGDQVAFDEIYKRCRGHITFVCAKFLISREDIEEVVQDTFFIAFKKSGELDTGWRPDS